MGVPSGGLRGLMYGTLFIVVGMTFYGLYLSGGLVSTPPGGGAMAIGRVEDTTDVQLRVKHVNNENAADLSRETGSNLPEREQYLLRVGDKNKAGASSDSTAAKANPVETFTFKDRENQKRGGGSQRDDAATRTQGSEAIPASDDDFDINERPKGFGRSDETDKTDTANDLAQELGKNPEQVILRQKPFRSRAASRYATTLARVKAKGLGPQIDIYTVHLQAMPIPVYKSRDPSLAPIGHLEPNDIFIPRSYQDQWFDIGHGRYLYNEDSLSSKMATFPGTKRRRLLTVKTLNTVAWEPFADCSPEGLQRRRKRGGVLGPAVSSRDACLTDNKVRRLLQDLIDELDLFLYRAEGDKGRYDIATDLTATKKQVESSLAKYTVAVRSDGEQRVIDLLDSAFDAAFA